MVSFPKRYQFHQIGTPPPSGQSRHYRLPLVLPYPSASLPPLRVTLTHFTLLSYERAFRLPTCFPISGLARLGVKPRLCRSSWRAFASTHSLMLPSTSSGEALFACPPFPPWNLPSFAVESTLSYPCSRSDPPLSRPPPPMIWYSGQTALFLFPLEKAAPAFLPTALSVALFSFQQAQYVQVFPLKPAPFCTLFAGLGSTNKSAISLLLLSDSRSVLLSQTLWRIYLLSPSVLSGYNGSPDTRFSRGTTRLMSWPDGERYLRSPQSLVVSLLGLEAYCLI